MKLTLQRTKPQEMENRQYNKSGTMYIIKESAKLNAFKSSNSHYEQRAHEKTRQAHYYAVHPHQIPEPPKWYKENPLYNEFIKYKQSLKP